MMRSSLLVLFTAALLSGCLHDGRIQSTTIVVEYDGAQAGQHEDSDDCDSDGLIHGSGEVHDGQVDISVKDGSGNTLFEESFNGDIHLDSRSLNGGSGRWTLRADRSGNDLVGDAFTGNYRFTVAC